MTTHPIDTEALRREALGQLGLAAMDPRWPGRVLSLLDALAAAEHRATRAEAERDEWREASAKLAASSNQANADLHEAEARIKAVRALHTGTRWPGVTDKPVCDACDQPWPCPTIRALDGDA